MHPTLTTISLKPPSSAAAVCSLPSSSFHYPAFAHASLPPAQHLWHNCQSLAPMFTCTHNNALQPHDWVLVHPCANTSCSITMAARTPLASIRKARCVCTMCTCPLDSMDWGLVRHPCHGIGVQFAVMLVLLYYTPFNPYSRYSHSVMGR